MRSNCSRKTNQERERKREVKEKEKGEGREGEREKERERKRGKQTESGVARRRLTILKNSCTIHTTPTRHMHQTYNTVYIQCITS